MRARCKAGTARLLLAHDGDPPVAQLAPLVGDQLPYARVSVVGDNIDAPLAAFAAHQALAEYRDRQVGAVALDQRGAALIEPA